MLNFTIKYGEPTGCLFLWVWSRCTPPPSHANAHKLDVCYWRKKCFACDGKRTVAPPVCAMASSTTCNMADMEASSDVSGTSPALNNPLSRKLNKILESRLDNDKVSIQTKYIEMTDSSFYLAFSGFNPDSKESRLGRLDCTVYTCLPYTYIPLHCLAPSPFTVYAAWTLIPLFKSVLDLVFGSTIPWHSNRCLSGNDHPHSLYFGRWPGVQGSIAWFTWLHCVAGYAGGLEVPVDFLH